MPQQVVPLDPRHDRRLAEHVLSLQLRSYAVEAELIGDNRIPALRETVDDVIESTLSWLAVRGDDGEVIAAVGYVATSDAIVIDRLVVDPAHLRRGAGRLLVDAMKGLASPNYARWDQRDQDRADQVQARGRSVTVATGSANHPARALYERLGFVCTGEEEVLPGLSITHYRWPGPSTPDAATR